MDYKVGDVVWLFGDKLKIQHVYSDGCLYMSCQIYCHSRMVKPLRRVYAILGEKNENN